MKKVMLIVIVFLVLISGLYIVANMSDGPVPHFDASEGIDDSSFEAFLLSVAGPANFDRDNGFYKLWTLIEPIGTNIESDVLLTNIQRMHDPKYNNEKYLKEYIGNDKSWVAGRKYTGYLKPFMDKRTELIKKHGKFDSYSGNKDRDWAQFLYSRKDAALELISMYQPFLDRYHKLVDSDVFQEFTTSRPDASLPNLLSWLQIGRLYITEGMINALDGDWEAGIHQILAHIELTKKGLRGSRTLLFNLIAKALMKESLYGLASLMNQPEFPDRVYQKVIHELVPLQYEEFGTRVPLLLETYSLSHAKRGGLLFQQNRTRQYLFDFLSNLVNSEKILPYKWQSHPLEYKKVKEGLFWWLENPVGKIKFEKAATSDTVRNLFAAIFKAYSLKAVYDMTRISAELHLNYTVDKPVQAILYSLETYQTWLDPGSGNPYKWHPKKQLLYSFSTDRDDDDGTADYYSDETDITLPVILYIKK
jgi:hypothetical protein